MFCYCVPLCLCDDWTDVWVSCSAQSPIVWVWPMQGPELRNSFPVINTKTGSGCSKYVKCFSHAPIVWCSAFWNVKLLFCNDFALLAIATTHQSYSLKFSHSTASRGRTAWQARDILCVISIFQHYKYLHSRLSKVSDNFGSILSWSRSQVWYYYIIYYLHFYIQSVPS